MRVKFTQDFAYRPSGERRVTILYRADGGPDQDGSYTVKREAGEAAIAVGAAHEIKASKKDDAESE